MGESNAVSSLVARYILYVQPSNCIIPYDRDRILRIRGNALNYRQVSFVRAEIIQLGWSESGERYIVNKDTGQLYRRSRDRDELNRIILLRIFRSHFDDRRTCSIGRRDGYLLTRSGCNSDLRTNSSVRQLVRIFD